MAIGLAEVVELVRKPNPIPTTNSVISPPDVESSSSTPQPPSTPPQQSAGQSPHNQALSNGFNAETSTKEIEESPFRGAFSTEDTHRGAVNLLRQEQKESASLASKSVRNGKAREESEETGAGEERDIAEEMTTDQHVRSKGKNSKRPALTNKTSMWGTYRRGRNGDAQHAYQEELNATASSSEDEAEVEPNVNPPTSKSSRPRIKRATTGWNALREKIKGGNRIKPDANELNETLEGHRELVSCVDDLALLLILPSSSTELTTELALGTLPMCVFLPRSRIASTISSNSTRFIQSESRQLTLMYRQGHPQDGNTGSRRARSASNPYPSQLHQSPIEQRSGQKRQRIPNRSRIR